MGDDMGKSIVKIYGDGEIWIDGRQEGKIYPDGEIYANGKLFGRIYEDGDIWIDGRKAGRVFANGDVWIGSEKVATGVYLLELLGDSDPPPPKDTTLHTSRTNSSGNAGSQFTNSRNRSSSGSFGFGFVFVTVLLVVAFIYGAFRFWLTELPTLLFGNMQIMGTAAMVSTYVCMVLVAYVHCSLATRSKEPMFLKAMFMQAAAFFANIIVFTILDLIALAISYGLSIGDALGEVGGAIGGSSLGMILVAVFVGLAPTIVSWFISFICIKKGKTISLPSGMKRVNRTAQRQKTKYQKQSRKLYWDGERIAKALVCLCFVGILTFFLSTLPMSIFMELEEMPIEMKRMILPALAVLAGILLRRKLYCAYHESFVLGWLVQSAVQIAACLAGWALDYGASTMITMPDVVRSSCVICVVMSLLIAFFTLPLVKD